MTSKSTSEGYSSSGRHGRAFSSSISESLASTAAAAAAAAAADTAAWSSGGGEFGHPCVPRLLVPCGSWLCQKLACCHFDPSRVATRRRRPFKLCLPLSFLDGIPLSQECPLLAYVISHGSRNATLSTSANLCRLLILPSGEWSRAGMIYYNFIAVRSEFGAVESRFSRCSPIA